jgi:hypothetical protein
MSTTLDYDQVLKVVAGWPPEQRASLAHALIDTLKPANDSRKPTLDQIVGIARGEGPAPTDEQVELWLDEHRMEKYGR